MSWFDSTIGATIPNPDPALDPTYGFTTTDHGAFPTTTYPGDTTGGWNTETPSTEQAANVKTAGSQAAGNFSNINDAFTAFVNANPQYKSGGQGAIDAFGQQYPQFSGIIAWDPNRQIYETQGGYFTNLPGNAQGGWSLTATSPETGGGAAGGQNPLNPTPFSYAPFTDQFSNPNFVAPTGLTEQNDPGYQQRLKMGTDALQASAAGKGTLLSGQAATDLDQYAQGFASNEFGKVYDRALQGYQQNSQNNWQQYSQKYQQYLNGFGQALQGYNTNLGGGQQAFGDTLALSAQNFGQQQQNWQNSFNTTALGLNAAGQAAGSGQNYANQGGGYLTGAGNAAAAGTIGSANGNLYGLGSLANYAQQTTPFFQSPYGSQSGGGYYPGNPSYPPYGTNSMFAP